MRNFLIANGYYQGDIVEDLPVGNVGIFGFNDGIGSWNVSNFNPYEKELTIVLGREVNLGGNVTIPLYPKDLTFSLGFYSASTTFTSTLTVTDPLTIGTYSVIIVKKGVKFNERSKWTSSVYLKSINGVTAESLATDLVVAINNNTIASGVSATSAGGVITFTSTTPGIDYVVVPADNLYPSVTNITSIGSIAYGDVAHIIDLSNKAAADAGLNYTMGLGDDQIYPNYPINPLVTSVTVIPTFTIVTLRFAEPRKVKTRDEIVHQIVQVAFTNEEDAFNFFNGLSRISGWSTHVPSTPGGN